MKINISGLSEGVHQYNLSSPAGDLGLESNFIGDASANITLEKSIHQILARVNAYVKGVFVCDRCAEEFSEVVKTSFTVVYTWEQPEEGEVTDVLEAENGYYVAKIISLLDRDATDNKKESIVSQRKSDQYQSICKKWKKKTDIKVHKKVWNTISCADQGVKVKSTNEDTDTSSDSSSK